MATLTESETKTGLNMLDAFGEAAAEQPEPDLGPHNGLKASDSALPFGPKNEYRHMIPNRGGISTDPNSEEKRRRRRREHALQVSILTGNALLQYNLENTTFRVGDMDITGTEYVKALEEEAQRLEEDVDRLTEDQQAVDQQISALDQQAAEALLDGDTSQGNTSQTETQLSRIRSIADNEYVLDGYVGEDMNGEEWDTYYELDKQDVDMVDNILEKTGLERDIDDGRQLTRARIQEFRDALSADDPLRQQLDEFAESQDVPLLLNVSHAEQLYIYENFPDVRVGTTQLAGISTTGEIGTAITPVAYDDLRMVEQQLQEQLESSRSVYEQAREKLRAGDYNSEEERQQLEDYIEEREYLESVHASLEEKIESVERDLAEIETEQEMLRQELSDPDYVPEGPRVGSEIGQRAYYNSQAADAARAGMDLETAHAEVPERWREEFRETYNETLEEMQAEGIEPSGPEPDPATAEQTVDQEQDAVITNTMTM